MLQKAVYAITESFSKCFYAVRQKARKNLKNRNKFLQNESWAWFLTQHEVMCGTVNKSNLVLMDRYLVSFSLALHFIGSTFLFCCPRHRDRHFTLEHLKKTAGETETGSKWRKENGPRGAHSLFPLSAHTALEALLQCKTPQTGERPKLWQRTEPVTGQICGKRWVDVEKVEEWWGSSAKLIGSFISFTYSFGWDGNKSQGQLQMSRRCGNPHSGWYWDH